MLYISLSLVLSLSHPFVQIDKIMSSIGAGIGSGLDIKEDTSGKIHTSMYSMREHVSECDLKDHLGLLQLGSYVSS